MSKILVMLSGGIDSTLCIALAIKKYKRENVRSLIIDYGQNNGKEVYRAVKICKFYNIEYDVINIRNIFKYSNSSLVKTSGKNIPYLDYDTQYKNLKKNEDVSTNVEFRNGVMLSICASYAISHNIDIIYYGIHKEEGVAYMLYPDCGDSFNKVMNKAIYIGSGKKVKINAPLVDMYKKEIIKLATELNIPFKLTWTCYENGKYACGKCTACTDRIKAFKENNLIDPMKYEEA